MDRVLHGLGNLVVRHPWRIVLVWVVVFAVGVVFAPRLQEVFEREFVTGNTGESQRAADVIADEFSDRSAFQQQLVFTSSRYTVDDPRYERPARAVMDRVESSEYVTKVTSWFSTGQGTLLSQDRRTTYAVLDLRSTTHSDGMTSSGEIIDMVEATTTPDWLQTYVTGTEAVHADLTTGSEQSLSRAERVGLPVALVVLIGVFGALVAALLPLTLGVLSIVVALALAFLVGQWMNLSVFLETFATMLGLGVGIDYALFMLTRYRGERDAGRDIAASAVETVRHAGKAVAFSGLTVVIGLSALLATREPTVISIGLGGVLVVLVAMAAALTLLPAAIALLGDRIEAPRSLTRLLHRHRRGGGFWANWARHVMRRPGRYATLGVVVIAVLAWPTLDLDLGSLGVRLLGQDAQSRQGYETLADEFGEGLTAPVEIVVRSSAGADDPTVVAAVDRLTTAVAEDPRFAGALSMTSAASDVTLEEYQAAYADNFAGVPDELRGPLSDLVNLEGDSDTALVLGFLAGDPGSSQSWETIRALRSDIIPTVDGLDASEVLVGGTTAIEADSTEALYARFPLVIGIILTATFVLLMVLFRSILIPLKAVIMNLFSVFASYGLLVLVFQEGLGENVFDFTSIAAVNWLTPVLLFAVLFGLSMDYEVFLMSRIRELHDRGHSNEESVALGLERTGRVITGAAAIMVVVFGAFLLSPILAIKELGFALAAAVLIDATLIRVVLVPATMRLLGDWNWWLPGPLARILPTIELERDIPTQTPPAPPDGATQPATEPAQHGGPQRAA